MSDLLARSVAPLRASVTVTSAYTMTSADRVVRVDCTAAAVTITLPPALAVVGELIRVLKIDTSANAVTVNVTSPDTIGPSALTTFSLTLAGQAKTLRAARNGDTVTWDDVAPLIGTLTALTVSGTGTFSSYVSVGSYTPSGRSAQDPLIFRHPLGGAGALYFQLGDAAGQYDFISASGSNNLVTISNAGLMTVMGAIGVNGASPPAKPTITGSRSAATASVLAQVLTALANMGILTDSTSA